jgi:hypothetical protein
MFTQLTNSPTPTAASTLQSAAHGLALACRAGVGVNDQTTSAITHPWRDADARWWMVHEDPSKATFDARALGITHGLSD